MIKVENIKVYNLANALYSARNPLQSWDKSTSDRDSNILCDADLELAKKLYKAGSEHRKWMRQAFVSMDVTAPLYWWKEADQYKVGTVTDSESTMHCIHKKQFMMDDFSHDQLSGSGISTLEYVVGILNYNREKYLETKNKDYWWQIIQLLPTSYNQMRTWTANYEVCANIISQRKTHKLDEWVTFCDILLRELPYLREIMDFGTEDA